MDAQNPAVKLIIKGCDTHGYIINRGTRVNVINEAICRALGINQMESCPFWLRMADTRFVLPLSLIRQLDFILGVHTFTISIVVLWLDALGAYPLLLGRPWLYTENIK